MRKWLIILLIAATSVHGAIAQARFDEITATPGKAGGVYYAYPVTESANTPPPAGFEPFYISHYGRHGSRYLISDNDYVAPAKVLRRAKEHNALTPLGLDVLNRLDSVYTEARGRGGELSPLGYRQHKAIAQRMYDAFPQVFAKGARVDAASTTIMRCAHSMWAFTEGLRDNAPWLEIPRESSERNMYYLNYHSPESGPLTGHDGPYYQTWRKYKADRTNADRLVSSLFSDPTYVAEWIDPQQLMWQLYWVTVGQQNIESTLDFTDLFTPQELYDLWTVFNFEFFGRNSSYAPAGGAFVKNASNLVRHIVEQADSCIASGRHGATLRFGHDGNIVPLAALLGLKGCYTDITAPDKLPEGWADFEVSPMAANLQIVFFRNKKGEIIAKLMLNERETSIPVKTDIFPYYRWEDLRPYLLRISE